MVIRLKRLDGYSTDYVLAIFEVLMQRNANACELNLDKIVVDDKEKSITILFNFDGVIETDETHICLDMFDSDWDSEHYFPDDSLHITTNEIDKLVDDGIVIEKWKGIATQVKIFYDDFNHEDILRVVNNTYGKK